MQEEQQQQQPEQQKSTFQVIPLDLSIGSTWSPDSETSVQNRYLNVFIGLDGAVYPIPIKKNAKKLNDQKVVVTKNFTTVTKTILNRVLALKKIGSGSLTEDVATKYNTDMDFGVRNNDEWSRFCYVSIFQYGCLNFFYDRSLVPNEVFDSNLIPNSKKESLKSFDSNCYRYVIHPTDKVDSIKYLVRSVNISIAVDEKHKQVVFPCYWMFQPFVKKDPSQEVDEDGNPIGPEGATQTYDRKDIFEESCTCMSAPLNMVVASTDAQMPVLERIKPLVYKNAEGEEPEEVPITKNDFCSGALNVSSSFMAYYSQRFNEIRISKPIQFGILQTVTKEEEGATPSLTNVTLPYQVQGLEYHNNSLPVLRTDGISRFSLNADSTSSLFTEDPLWFVKCNVRFSGSLKSVGTELLFFSEEGRVKSISSQGDDGTALRDVLPYALPALKGRTIYSDNRHSKSTGIVTICEMDFLFIGNWLLNLSKKNAEGDRKVTVTNYQLDTFAGHNEKYGSPENEIIIDETDPAHLCFSVTKSNIVCDYNSIGTFQSYKETIADMIKAKSNLLLSFYEGDYSYGEVKNITTRPLQRDSAFRVSRLLLTLRTDLLKGLRDMPEDFECKLFLKTIIIEEDDNFDYYDEKTWVDLVSSTDENGEPIQVADEERVLDLAHFARNNSFSSTFKPPAIFNVSLANVNSVSFSLTWKGGYPVIIEKLELEVEN